MTSGTFLGVRDTRLVTPNVRVIPQTSLLIERQAEKQVLGWISNIKSSTGPVHSICTYGRRLIPLSAASIQEEEEVEQQSRGYSNVPNIVSA